MPLKEGQTSILPRGLEGLWGIHTLYIGDQSMLESMKRLGLE